VICAIIGLLIISVAVVAPLMIEGNEDALNRP
jgi:hypothetical protein